MPARAACRNERLLQRKNQQVILTVGQDSTHRSIGSRFRHWGTIRQQSAGMDPFLVGERGSEFNRNPFNRYLPRTLPVGLSCSPAWIVYVRPAIM
jgi:hypothetical protein